MFILLSKNNFTTYSCYGSFNSFEENNEIFSIATGKLTPGEYSYLVIARDYANNTLAFQDSRFNLSIPPPLMDFIFISSIIIIITVIGISIFVLYEGLKKHSHISKEI